MSNCNEIVSTLTKNGSDQSSRFIAALQPKNLSLNHFETDDWILFAYNFAQYINYYNSTNSSIPTNNWVPFLEFFKLEGKEVTYKKPEELFKIKKEIKEIIAETSKDASLTPHLTLFITFLLLLDQSTKRLNKLTKKHLDFYYSEVLKIQKTPATPDKVYLLFELAKNFSEQKIETKTAFDGGKDPDGKTKNYLAVDEAIINKTSVVAQKNVYNTGSKIVGAPIANSYDGLGKAFPDGSSHWWPFGYTNDPKNTNELPNATIGFAIASPTLALNEGLRNVQLTFTFENDLTVLTTTEIIEALTVVLSSSKKWIETQPSSTDITTKTGALFSTKTEAKTLKIAFQLDENTEGLTNYSTKVLGDEFETTLPIAKFTIDTSLASGYKLYQAIASNTLMELHIEVDVQNIKNVTIENDNSILNATKPFYPFTTQPIVGSNFYIQYTEALSKNWDNIQIDLDWKNTPESFVEHYKAYKNSAKDSISLKEFIDSLINASDAYVGTDKIIDTNNYFKYGVDVLTENTWFKEATNQTLFDTTTSLVKSKIIIPNTSHTLNTLNNGKLKLILESSFYHHLYPKIYALALTATTTESNIILPNEPYTPLVEQLKFHYSASETIPFNSATEESYNDNASKLIHLHPYGYSEEHLYLKSQFDFLSNVEKQKLYLVPSYCIGGSLFIGLENAEQLQQITLLFQVLEGSEDPTTPSFVGKQKIEWSVLCQNEWKKLSDSDIILNETDNLLQSGRFIFNVPEEASNQNTVLPKNSFWLKAKMHKQYNAVCKVIGIHAQVVLAKFKDNDNNLTHLSTGLEANTISKLSQRISAVKSVTQPYNSFGFKPEESDEDYYRRISERLRHKNRAITMWDYEHIVLQKFPELYKVKCLNHTCDCSFQSPGNVTLVLIPDTTNKNVFDIYQPRVSTATLNKVKKHISKLNSLHVNTHVINPIYEEVSISLKAKFREGLDFNYYANQLNTDITQFLSPWAFEKNKKIQFGESIHISKLILYIEELKYVDFVEDIKMYKDSVLTEKVVAPSSPKAILVSAKTHAISPDVTNCKSPIIESEEACQL